MCLIFEKNIYPSVSLETFILIMYKHSGLHSYLSPQVKVIRKSILGLKKKCLNEVQYPTSDTRCSIFKFFMFTITQYYKLSLYLLYSVTKKVMAVIQLQNRFDLYKIFQLNFEELLSSKLLFLTSSQRKKFYPARIRFLSSKTLHIVHFGHYQLWTPTNNLCFIRLFFP